MRNNILTKIAIKALIVKGRMDVKRMKNNAKNAKATNEALLFKILRENQTCKYGKLHNFANIHTIEEFRKNVPICEYGDLAEYIEDQYENNAKYALSNNKIVGYANSSGSIGKRKVIPESKKDVSNYINYTVTRFLALADEYARKHRGSGFKPAKGISLFAHDDTLSPCGLPSSNIPDVAERKYAIIEPLILLLPLGRQFIKGEVNTNYAYARFGLEYEDCAYLFFIFAKGIAEFLEYIRDNWQNLVNEIEHGTLNNKAVYSDEVREKLKKRVKPNPKRAAELRKEFEKGFDETIIKRIWPNLSVISAIGTSSTYEGFSEKIKKYTKGIPMDYSIYGASEGLAAAAYRVEDKGQILLTDSCYYEFIAEDDENAEHVLSMDEIEVGKCYEILLTNQSGFYRYRIRDVIEVLGFYKTCPIINFVYRKGQLLSITGEKTNIKQMTEAVKRLAKVANVQIDEWAVMVDKGEEQYRYALIAENKAGKDLSVYYNELHQILKDVNTAYDTYSYIIGTPIIMNQKVGTHRAWVEHKMSIGVAESQVKPVRYLDTEEKINFFLSRLEDKKSTASANV